MYLMQCLRDERPELDLKAFHLDDFNYKWEHDPKRLKQAMYALKDNAIEGEHHSGGLQ